jgi:hypothetical protein
MSTASGLGNYPFLAESTAEPSMHTSADRHDGLSGSQAVRMEDGSGDLWPRVTAIAPQLLLDKYVWVLLFSTLPNESAFTVLSRHTSQQVTFVSINLEI